MTNGKWTKHAYNKVISGLSMVNMYNTHWWDGKSKKLFSITSHFMVESRVKLYMWEITLSKCMYVSTNVKFMLIYRTKKKYKRNLHCNMIYDDVTHHRHLLNTCFNVIERNNKSRKISADRHIDISITIWIAHTHEHTNIYDKMSELTRKQTTIVIYVNEWMKYLLLDIK